MKLNINTKKVFSFIVLALILLLALFFFYQKRQTKKQRASKDLCLPKKTAPQIKKDDVVQPEKQNKNILENKDTETLENSNKPKEYCDVNIASKTQDDKPKNFNIDIFSLLSHDNQQTTKTPRISSDENNNPVFGDPTVLYKKDNLEIKGRIGLAPNTAEIRKDNVEIGASLKINF